jgi:hypothetical protein
MATPTQEVSHEASPSSPLRLRPSGAGERLRFLANQEVEWVTRTFTETAPGKRDVPNDGPVGPARCIALELYPASAPCLR